VPFDPEPLMPAPEPAPPTDATSTWHVPGVPEPGPEAVQPEEPEPEPVPVLDLDALDDAHELMSNLRATVAALGVTAERVTAEARAVVDEHGRTVGRLDRAAQAASRAALASWRSRPRLCSPSPSPGSRSWNWCQHRRAHTWAARRTTASWG